MFEILKLLREIRALRTIHWEIRDGVMHVEIPVSEDDEKLIADMQRMFAPIE